MIDYKNSSVSDALITRISSANVDGTVSLTWLWEVIVRTKRLPDNLDPKVLFIVLRDRLRNPEREVRQHALRVLSDLIPVVQQEFLDQHMEIITPELIINLSNVAPSVRKGSVDVLRIYLKHTVQSNEILKKLLTSVPDDNHLMLGILMAAPYFSNQQINEETLRFLLNRLFLGTTQELFRETSICSLAKARRRLGVDRFNNLIGPEKLKEFLEMCHEQNIDLTPGRPQDNVILETEISLQSGPAITMKIHEEADQNMRYDQHLYTDDSELEQITRSPRKVHFGGEVVKMRTPESDSNQQSSDDNDIQASLVIDRPTSIKISVNNGVTAIKTRNQSMIPVRITAEGSNPATPQKKVKPKKRLHKSAPELRKIHVSKIPLRTDFRNNLNKPKRDSKASVVKSSKAGRHSRGLDDVSPIPVHHEIEVFHNLTRSPTRSPQPEPEIKKLSPEEAQVESSENNKDTFPSFQVCKEEIKGENSPHPLNVIVSDLMHKGDIWTQNRALDNLIIFISKSNQQLNSIPLPQLLQALFACEKQQRLQNRSQEALRMVIMVINPQTLQESLPILSNGLVRIAAPSRVRLALLAMERSSPKIFFENLKTEPQDREGMLQILIAAARTFPSSELDVIKGTQLAFEAMTDNKRVVRQAALEAIASLAQIAGNTIILDTIVDLGKTAEDSQQLLRIIRTRLSRRQLPIVDFNGNIRYSSPREQEEFEWLCGGNSSLSKTASLGSIKISENNYWKRNSRRDLLKSPSLVNNEDSSTDESKSKEQVWTIDGTTFPKIDHNNGVVDKAILSPVYVLHRESPQVNGRSYRNYDRGRSNSPPRQQESSDDVNRARRYFRQNEQFRKSFSSEHIYTGGANKLQEPTSFSLSSRSSTTSTGSSTRSGLWLREFRSGIPIPISSDFKMKFRTARNSSNSYSGPLIAQEPLNRTKLDSPQVTPVILRTSPQQIFTPNLPPASSGSESSGYFTPPAEHHLKDQVLERFVSEQNNNFSPEEPNFQVVDSEFSDTPQNDDLRESSASSSFEANEARIEEITEETHHQVSDHEENKPPSPLDEIDFSENPRYFSDPRTKSRSEANLKNSLPEITERKNVNSAPPINDIVSIVPYRYAETPAVTSLPGSVTSSEHTPTKIKESPKILLKRSISTRVPTLKKTTETAKTERPFTRPKEALVQSLSQMESGDWENILQGLNNLSRLAKNHPEVLEPQTHSICVALAKSIKNLRSQVARSACRTAIDMFTSCRKALDMELEELAGPLLQRTADTNKFLRSDANAALDTMSLYLSIPRVVAVVTNKGSTHQNCVVRAAATRILSEIATRVGSEKVFQLPKETRDKFLNVGANGLTEGSLETRKHAKTLISTLAQHQHFQRALLEAVPQHVIRHITKIIKGLK